MENKINEIVETYKKANLLRDEFKEDYGVLNIHINHDGAYGPTYDVLIQYSHTVFVDRFTNFEVKERDDDVFPYELYFKDNNVEHIALFTETEYRKYVLKEAK